MRPENFRFGGGVEQTVLHPLVLVAMLIGMALLLFLPRKYAVTPLLVLAFLVPCGQQIVIHGVHVFVLRFVILAGWVRFSFSRYRSRIAGGVGTFDKLFLAWAFLHILTFLLLFREMGALVNQMGFLWDYLGGFFLLRFFIRNDEDIERVIKLLSGIVATLAVAMVYEHYKGLNPFGLLGGVTLIPEMRSGLYRAQGPFAHALLAGTFGATLLPLFLWLWIQGKSRALASVGVIASSAMAVAANCSTPLLAYAAAVGGICMWPLRRQMRLILLGLVMGLVGLHLVMKAPVWYLIAHVDVVGGSSSDHRAQLLNLFITRIGDWWLIGTDSNPNWGWGMWDTANQYVAEGWTGGLATLVCFFGLIVLAFRRLGAARRAVSGDPRREWYFWLLGSAMFAHVVAFFGISYFDQTRVLWFTLLAIISAAVVPVLKKRPAQRRASAELSVAHPELAYSGAALHDSASISRFYVGHEPSNRPQS